MSTKDKDLFEGTEIFNTKNVRKYKLAIIVSNWNNDITENLFSGAYKALTDRGVEEKNIVRMDVPGSFELVFGAKLAIEKIQNLDGVIVLGSVIRGETSHFDYICEAVSQGIKDLNIKYNIPVIFGVLTDNNKQQSIDRSGGKYGNKGIECGITALKMINLNKGFQ